ncbi:MAG: aminotransferase class I/II-fold pyridoxal phosphate-dependent enzyme [Burkholderiales bacterium]|nr:aminotransferase class I/II-fold pyridoxal phosphate-dependent enzyme [Burkholderiales bacterium]
MEVGQPSAGAPQAALQAAERAMRSEKLGYWESGALKERIALHYLDWYGVEVAPERVVLTPGASGALLLAFAVLLDAGDRVAMGRPGYPAYRNVLRALGMEPVELACGLETRFQPTAAMIEALDPAPAALILASPANPTGTMLDRAELTALVEVCRRRRIALISDEIYHGISYGAPAVSALEIDASTIVINSFSKYWCMTGWRLGWMVAPEHLVERMNSYSGNIFLTPSALSQHAALAAMDAKDELSRHLEAYASNRNLVMNELRRLGITDLAPADGAFYVYAGVGHLTEDSLGFCKQLLADTGVAFNTGLDFDPVDGHKAIRISFAVSPAETAEAMKRFGGWLLARR